MPPYLLAVVEEAWENSWNSLPICSAVMPMPVSATASVIQSRPFSCPWRASMVMVPCSVNLLALLMRFSSACRSRIWSACIVPIAASQLTDDLVAVLRRQRLDGLDHVVDQRRKRERFEMKLHPPGLDLGQVEDVVDQGEQVPARAEHAVERLGVLLSASASSRSISLTPMMALSGVRSSWLILARNCDLCWLASASWRLLSWISSNSRTFSIAIAAWSAKVDDQLDLLVGERPHLGARQCEHADRDAFAQHRNAEHGAKTAESLRLERRCIPDRPAHRGYEPLDLRAVRVPVQMPRSGSTGDTS